MRTLCLVLLLLVSQVALVGEEKQYPVTLKLLETKHNTSTSSASHVDTNCTQNPWNNDVNCSSQQVGGGQHVTSFSTVEASDGNTYEVECVPGFAGRFLQGGAEAVAAQNGTTSYSGCGMQPGIYHARWDKGRLKILVFNSKGKSKEWTFGIRSSRATVQEVKQPVLPTAAQKAAENSGESANLLLSSTPPGADVELDASFIGQTPSTVPVQPGNHTVRITKPGFQPWEKQLRTSGGQITIAAELEPVHK